MPVGGNPEAMKGAGLAVAGSRGERGRSADGTAALKGSGPFERSGTIVGLTTPDPGEEAGGVPGGGSNGEGPAPGVGPTPGVDRGVSGGGAGADAPGAGV